MLFNDKNQTNIYKIFFVTVCMRVNESVDIFVLYTLTLMSQVRVSITIFAYFKYMLAVLAAKLHM